MKEISSHYRENGPCCYFHPKEVLVGVCPLCLNERLLILAAKQGLNTSNNSSKLASNNYRSKPSVSLPKSFALGSGLLHHRDIRHRHSNRSGRKSDRDFADDPDSTSTSLEEDESFISIKFGDNGVASWDKSSSTTVSKVSLEHCSMSWAGQTLVKDANYVYKGNSDNSNSRSVVGHTKPQASLRWRKQVGQLLQLIRWKRSSKANAGGGSNKVEGVKVMRNNKGWIRTLKD